MPRSRSSSTRSRPRQTALPASRRSPAPTIRVPQADVDSSGAIDLDEFLHASDALLASNPARCILVVGGPGSGKGVLCRRLVDECDVSHVSCGDLLRSEVEADTPLGREVAGIMLRGELVSSALIVTLLRRRMRSFGGPKPASAPPTPPAAA